MDDPRGQATVPVVALKFKEFWIPLPAPRFRFQLPDFEVVEVRMKRFERKSRASNGESMK